MFNLSGEKFPIMYRRPQGSLKEINKLVAWIIDTFQMNMPDVIDQAKVKHQVIHWHFVYIILPICNRNSRYMIVKQWRPSWNVTMTAFQKYNSELITVVFHSFPMKMLTFLTKSCLPEDKNPDMSKNRFSLTLSFWKTAFSIHNASVFNESFFNNIRWNE